LAVLLDGLVLGLFAGDVEAAPEPGLRAVVTLLERHALKDLTGLCLAVSSNDPSPSPSSSSESDMNAARFSYSVTAAEAAAGLGFDRKVG
jgi:hypothetical protein